ncbi:unnamed protein product, partial [Didymodactylos carnosus]
MERCNHAQLGILAQTSCTITPQVKTDNVPDLTHTDLTSSQRHQLKQLIQHFPTTHPGARPTNSQPYRMAPLKQAHASTAVDDMLHDDVISSSSNPWAAPVVLAPKKDSTLRFCVDYRKLNALTEYEQRKYLIADASRTLTPAERKYGATEKEARAIVWAIKHFRPYIEGVHVTVRSNCKALQWLKNSKDSTGRLARWALKLDAFDPTIEHRSGKTNENADGLSRYPVSHSSSQPDSQHQINLLDSTVNLWEACSLLKDIQARQQEKVIDLTLLNDFHNLMFYRRLPT